MVEDSHQGITQMGLFIRSASGSRRFRRCVAVGVECLEGRALLATATFSPPDLTGFIEAARNGKNTGPATINTMVSALQNQLTSGPLADLTAGTDTPASFQTAVSDLVTSYQSNVNAQLSPEFPNITNILNLEGTKIESELSALVTQESVGLITSATLQAQAGTAINGLTAGPLLALHTPFSGYVTATQTLETELNLLPPTLATGATPSLTVAQVQQAANADSKAYSDAMASALYLHPNVNAMVNSALSTFNSSVSTLGQNGADAQTQLTAAIASLDTALLDVTGLFGPQGVVAKALHKTDSDNDGDRD
jgi:hypothetical protein